MAQKVQTLFVDDIDGSDAEGTVRFGLDGTDYEIDLNATNAQALRDALARFTGAARRVSGSHPASAAQRTQSIGERSWTRPRSASGPRRRESR